eukprot:6653221-Pyramimonas_sp.AAC.1
MSKQTTKQMSSAKNALVGCLWPVARRFEAERPLASSPWCPRGCQRRGTVRRLARQRPATAPGRAEWGAYDDGDERRPPDGIHFRTI